MGASQSLSVVSAASLHPAEYILPRPQKICRAKSFWPVICRRTHYTYSGSKISLTRERRFLMATRKVTKKTTKSTTKKTAKKRK